MLTPSQAALSFYCEVYRDSGGSVAWLVRVLDQQGRSIVATQPAQAALGPGGGPLTGALDLGGLPPGAYRLALVIGSGADTVSRSAPFRMGGAGQGPGWRTDRGRIFIKYGEPDQVTKRPQSGPDLPWEAWKFSRTRGLKFVFMDMTRLGNYSLLYTNDRTETSVPNWATKLS